MPSLSGGTTYLSGAVVIENDAISGTAASLTIGSGAAQGAVLSGSATLDFASTATLVDDELTISVTGAAVGDPVAVGTPAAPNGNTVVWGYVSAANTVTVRFNNTSGGTIDPASGTYKVKVFK